MVKLTDEKFLKDTLIFPGSTLIASWQNTQNNKLHFDMILANDIAPGCRKSLIKRIDSINNLIISENSESKIQYYIPDPEKGRIDSNSIIDDFIEKIKMLENVSFRKEMISKGRKHSGRFSWDECHLQTKEFYHKVFQEKLGMPFEQ